MNEFDEFDTAKMYADYMTRELKAVESASWDDYMRIRFLLIADKKRITIRDHHKARQKFLQAIRIRANIWNEAFNAARSYGLK